MYGLPFESKVNEIRKNKNILIVIGGEKVPGEVYRLVDYNLSVTNQPHSEVASLGVFLYSLGKAKKKFKNAKLSITPMTCGKCVKSKK